MSVEAGIDGMACRYALHAGDVFQNRVLNRFGSRKNVGINYSSLVEEFHFHVKEPTFQGRKVVNRVIRARQLYLAFRFGSGIVSSLDQRIALARNRFD